MMQRSLLFAVLASAGLGLFVRWVFLTSQTATEVVEVSPARQQTARVLAASDSTGPVLAVGDEGALVFTIDSSTLVVHSGATLDIQGRLRSSGSIGEAGQVLTSGGASQPPIWKTLADLITGDSSSPTPTPTSSPPLTQTPTAGNLLIADGDSWESVSLGGDAGLTAAGTLTINPNSVALTTDTTGNYVATVADSGSDTITVTNGSGEGSAVKLEVVGVTCTDCLGTDHIQDVYVLNSGDELTGALTFRSQNEARFADSDSSNYVGFKGPSTISTNQIWTLPSADGSSSQVLSTNGSGALSWATAGGGSMTSFTLAGDTGSSQTISDSNTLTVATGAGLTATAGATDTVTLSVDDDGLDFAQFDDALDLDAATTITNALSGNLIVNLSSTGDFVIQDAGVTYATFADDSTVTFTSTLTVPTVTLSGTGTINGLDAIDSTSETTLEAALDIAGDISGTGLASVSIGADKVLESNLKAVDSAADEECLTYESTVGDFEWQTCGSGSMSSFTLAGDTGSSQTISDGNTLTVATGAGLTATAGATDTVTLSVDNDGLDFAQFDDALDLDAATTITNALSGDFTIDLTSTGDFIVADAGVAFATFADDKGITFGASVIDAGGASSFEIPNGSGPTVDATGEIAVDTTGDDLIYYGGSAKRNLTYKQTKSAVIENPSDVDNFLLFKAPYNLTISNIKCIVDPADSSETVVIKAEERDSDGDNAAGVDGSTTITCANTSTADDGSLSNPTIDANDWVSLDIGAVTGTITQLSVTLTYTKDAE